VAQEVVVDWVARRGAQERQGDERGVLRGRVVKARAPFPMWGHHVGFGWGRSGQGHHECLGVLVLVRHRLVADDFVHTCTTKHRVKYSSSKMAILSALQTVKGDGRISVEVVLMKRLPFRPEGVA